jgi:hypothetical protein
MMINGVDYLSRKTSCNRVPVGIKALVEYLTTTCNLDYGGGRYDTATNWLKERGIENHVYDPFNRTPEHNAAALNHKFTSVTLLNVLNTIESREERIAAIRDAYERVERGGIFVVQIYEGNKSGVGAVTKSKTYQHNHKLNDYKSEISEAIGMPFICLENKQHHILVLERKSAKLEKFLRSGKRDKTCWI